MRAHGLARSAKRCAFPSLAGVDTTRWPQAFPPSDASFSSFPCDPEGPWVSATRERGTSVCLLAGVHQAAWPQASGPKGTSYCLLAHGHEARWVSAIAGWVHPSCHLAASFSPYGCPPRRDGYILFVVAVADLAGWIHPSSHMGVSLRVRGSPIDHEGWSRPAIASLPPAEADTDQGKRLSPPK